MSLRAAAVFGLSLGLAGCGYIGDTRPPSLKLPTAVTDLAAVERGAKIIVQCTIPSRTTEDVVLVDPPKMVVTVGERTYEMPLPKTVNETVGHVEIDAQPFYNRDVQIWVKAQNPRGQDAGLSNIVLLHVTPAIPTPANLRAEAVEQGVRVSWESGAKEFSVFRQGPGDKALVQLGTAAASPYVDQTTEYGKEYRYAVMASAGALNQSEIAEMAKPMVPVDTFPPAAPVGLAAVVGPNSVELVWDRSTEGDLAGYRVYRDAGSAQFERIGESADAPSFSDKKVEAGKRYKYAVTAYDRAGNESKLSEVVEAVIP